MEALENAPIVYELDIIRIEQLNNPRLLQKIQREGMSIYPECAQGNQGLTCSGKG